MWHRRQASNPNVARVFAVEKGSGSGLCSSSTAAVVYTEHLHTRLSDYRLGSVPPSELTFVMKEALEGLLDIKAQFNVAFPVTPDLVGFNADSTVKVWMNKDLALNYPQERFMRGMVDGENRMVLSFFTMFEGYAQKRFSPALKARIDKLRVPRRLRDAKDMIEDYDQMFGDESQLESRVECVPIRATDLARLTSPSPLPDQTRSECSSEVSYREGESTTSCQAKVKTVRLVLNLYKGPGSRL